MWNIVSQTAQVSNIYILERVDQGHLHPILKVPKLTGNRTCTSSEGGAPPSVLLTIQNIYLWPCDMAPPGACGYMNILEQTLAVLGCRPNSTCKSMYSLSSKTDHVRVTTMEGLDQGHLHTKLEVPRLLSQSGSNPGLCGGRRALAKSYKTAF